MDWSPATTEKRIQPASQLSKRRAIGVVVSMFVHSARKKFELPKQDERAHEGSQRTLVSTARNRDTDPAGKFAQILAETRQ